MRTHANHAQSRVRDTQTQTHAHSRVAAPANTPPFISPGFTGETCEHTSKHVGGAGVVCFGANGTMVTVVTMVVLSEREITAETRSPAQAVGSKGGDGDIWRENARSREGICFIFVSFCKRSDLAHVPIKFPGEAARAITVSV